MDVATRHYLNSLNREFYRVTATSFDETRGQPWQGWERLLPHLHPPLSVLDVGCGNGRFGVFLTERLVGTRQALSLPTPLIHYHGIDSSPALLTIAHQKLAEQPGIAFTMENCDILENPPDSGEYDVVALFGVLHHIPGFAQRQTLMKQLAQRVKLGGLLAFACWRFYEYERFRKRIVPWSAELQVEPHDYLLDWRRGDFRAESEPPLRYCHYVDDAEHAELVMATGLSEIETYRADGQTGAVNRHSLLKRP